MAKIRNENIKELIQDTLINLCENRPLNSISLKLIASEANISCGTLYYYYKTKNDIIIDIANKDLDKQYNDFVNWIDDLSKDTSLHRAISYIIKRNISTLNSRLQLFLEATTNNLILRKELIRHYNQFIDLIADKLSSKYTDSKYLSTLLIIISDGLFIQQKLNNNINIDEFIDKTIKLIEK
ncbi:MAG: TetR/AcrR family transcriptional regulator [Bacilli bacterium]|nr:TetR/AcrR family transcriptional regulator [Bacilli bacterium]